jgi:hypothetical protein
MQVDRLLPVCLRQHSSNSGSCSNLGIFRAPAFAPQAPVEAVQALRESSAASLQSLRMPTSRDEQWRFTDIRKLLLTADVWPAPPHFSSVDVSKCTLQEADQTRVVVVDGVIAPALSHLEGLLDGIIVSNLASGEASAVAAEHLGSLMGQGQGGLDVFTALNGVAASDVLLVHIPDGKQLDKPLHIVYQSTGSGDGTQRLSSPRLLVVAGKHAEVEVVEEFTGDSGAYWTNAVAEFVLAEHSKVRGDKKRAWFEEKMVWLYLARHLGLCLQLRRCSKGPGVSQLWRCLYQIVLQCHMSRANVSNMYA